MILYHSTTPKKAKLYKETGYICKPVRGFTTLQAAMAWSMKVGRTVIYQVEGEPTYKLPDHHNRFGEAWWCDSDIAYKNIKCVFSAKSDA
jgi:hypothetical protein